MTAPQIMPLADDRIGEIAIPNLVPRLTETPGRVNWLGPPMESHNDEIFQGMLGLTEADMDRLRAESVI